MRVGSKRGRFIEYKTSNGIDISCFHLVTTSCIDPTTCITFSDLNQQCYGEMIGHKDGLVVS